jgi:hypothetical protein
MTVDEELSHLDDAFRKLKIDYDIYFGGGSKRPPYEAQFHVESIIKKYSDNPKLSFSQRFKFNGLMQKFGVHNDMWRQKVKKKEEGWQDPARRTETTAPPASAKPAPAQPSGFRVQWKDPDQEGEKVDQLYKALLEAKKKVGDNPDALNMDGFKRFVKAKTEQLKKDLRCQNVEYVVEVENGQVRLKAKGT